jgi:hypothetical protein
MDAILLEKNQWHCNITILIDAFDECDGFSREDIFVKVKQLWAKHQGADVAGGEVGLLIVSDDANSMGPLGMSDFFWRMPGARLGTNH